MLDRACGKAPATLAGDGGEGPARLLIVTGIRRDGDDRHEAGAIEHRLSLEIGEGQARCQAGSVTSSRGATSAATTSPRSTRASSRSWRACRLIHISALVPK